MDESVHYGLSIFSQENKRIFNQKNKKYRPGKVKVVNRMKEYLTALHKLFDHATYLKRLVRGKDVCTTQYGFGGALGGGFGASYEDQGGEKKNLEGNLGKNLDGKFSNPCKLKNQTGKLDILAREGRLTGVDFFIF